MKYDTIHRDQEARQGLFYAIGCYVLWGLFPLYWYPLTQTQMPAGQILAQRIVWSTGFALLAVLLFRQGPALWQAFRQPKALLIFACSAALLSANWLIYLWAITHQQVLESSLGYFISPIFSVLLGRIFFKERLQPWQAAAIILAASAVVWLAWLAGKWPWVALGLTVSFGFYGVLRKMAPLAALPGLALETLWMLPVAAVYLLWLGRTGELYWTQLPTLPLLIVMGSGIVTTVPLLLFAAGAKRISLANLGMIQYISPTCQFLTGLWVFREPFDRTRFIAYVLVWLAVGLYVWGSRRPQRDG